MVENNARLVTAAMLTSGGAMLDLFGGSYLPALFGLPSGDWEYRIRDPLADLVTRFDHPNLQIFAGQGDRLQGVRDFVQVDDVDALRERVRHPLCGMCGCGCAAA